MPILQTILTVSSDDATDEYDIDARKLGGKWDQAYEILCKHVTAAAAEIRVLSLRED